MKSALARFSLAIFGLAGLAILLPGVAAAQSQTFVSSKGNDANPCSRLLPCRNFQAAVNAVVEPGEVVALDSGSFGTISTNKSVTVTGEGVHASLVVPALGTGVVLSLGTDKHVALRHLSVQGPLTAVGIQATQGSGSTVTIDDVTVDGLANAIIYSSSSPSSSMLVDHASITSTTGEGIVTSGHLVVQRSHIQVGNVAVVGTDGSRVLIRESSITASKTFAVWAQVGSPGGAAQIFVEDSSITDCDTAIEAGCCSQPNALVTVSGSTLTGNNVVFETGTGSTIKSRSNNTIRDFTTLSSGTGTLTTFTAQ